MEEDRVRGRGGSGGGRAGREGRRMRDEEETKLKEIHVYLKWSPEITCLRRHQKTYVF